jgi:hypothetical protein
MPTMPNELISRGLDSDITLTHQRFLAAMEERLPSMNLETKERYFAVLSALVGKLEAPEKNLRDILQEMMSEVAAIIMLELNGR